MAIAKLASIKTLINRKLHGPETKDVTSPDPFVSDDIEPLPTIGFKVSFSAISKKMVVKVIGARHLPAKAGGLQAEGYFIKVKLFPGASKFETSVKPESWPSFKEDFTFHIQAHKPGDRNEQLNDLLCSSRFLVLTVFAVDNRQRRTSIGSVTWPLDPKNFTKRPFSLGGSTKDVVETEELWKRTTDLTNELSKFKQTSNKTNRKGQMQICVVYKTGDVGEDDTLVVKLNRLRWNLELAREYEQKKGVLLYCKISVAESEQNIKSKETKKFQPTISVNFTQDQDDAMVSANMPPPGHRREAITCKLSLCYRPSKIAKKVLLGRVVIGPIDPAVPDHKAGQLDRAFKFPGLAVTQWHDLV